MSQIWMVNYVKGRCKTCKLNQHSDYMSTTAMGFRGHSGNTEITTHPDQIILFESVINLLNWILDLNGFNQNLNQSKTHRKKNDNLKKKKKSSSARGNPPKTTTPNTNS